MPQANTNATSVQPEHEHLVDELAALPESERRAIVRKAEHMGQGHGTTVASWDAIEGGEAVEDAQRRVAEGSPVHLTTLARLDAALSALGHDLDPRAEELAEKSTSGLLTPEEHREYAEIVRLSDSLSLLRLQARALRSLRAAS